MSEGWLKWELREAIAGCYLASISSTFNEWSQYRVRRLNRVSFAQRMYGMT